MYSIKRIIKAVFWLLFGSKAQRRRVRQECARIAASLFGDFYISEDYKLWREDKSFTKEYKLLSPGNPYSEERKFALREFARQAKGLTGSMAECGCYMGASAYFLAKELPDCPLHLFDSFEGLSPPGKNDIPDADYLLWKEGDLTSGEQEIKHNLRDFTNIHYYKGWIPDRFHEIEDEHFRLLHIDVDLYQPTIDSLKFFYPRMIKGGIIVLDDYGFVNCPGAYEGVEKFMSDKIETILHLPTGQGVIIKS